MRFESDIMCIDIFHCSDNWNGTRYEQADDVEFQSIGLTIPIAEMYKNVIFAEDTLQIKVISTMAQSS